MEPLLTTEEIADYLRVEVVTVRRLATRGELPAYRIGGEFRFMAQDIESFVKDQRVANDGINHRFDKFTERARKVLSFANAEAEALEHNYIGTEHLLLGIVREGEGVAAVALTRSGLTLNAVRERILGIIGESNQPVPPYPQERIKTLLREFISSGHGPNLSQDRERALTRRAKKVIELAVDEARNLKHHYIGTEHLLLGILREGAGVAATVLVAQGLQLDTVRELVLQILQERSTMTLPEIPEQAATLLTENEEGVTCIRCGAHSPEYFRYCFHCGIKFF